MIIRKLYLKCHYNDNYMLSVCHCVRKHLHALAHGGFERVVQSLPGVGLLHAPFLLGVVEPVVDFLRQIGRTACFEQAALVQCKLPCSGLSAVGNHGHQSRCKRLDTRDGFALHVAGMYIQIRLPEQSK